jgi:hypothetical protein
MLFSIVYEISSCWTIREFPPYTTVAKMIPCSEASYRLWCNRSTRYDIVNRSHKIIDWNFRSIVFFFWGEAYILLEENKNEDFQWSSQNLLPKWQRVLNTYLLADLSVLDAEDIPKGKLLFSMLVMSPDERISLKHSEKIVLETRVTHPTRSVDVFTEEQILNSFHFHRSAHWFTQSPQKQRSIHWNCKSSKFNPRCRDGSFRSEESMHANGFLVQEYYRGVVIAFFRTLFKLENAYTLWYKTSNFRLFILHSKAINENSH